MTLSDTLIPVVDAGACPHLAILLDRAEDAVPVLARFYALGARRDGWLFHRALPMCGDVDRRALTDAGLDVTALEAQDRLLISDEPLAEDPEAWVGHALKVFDDAKARGFGTVWWSRFPVPPDAHYYAMSLAYDRAFHEAMSELDAVSLCLYVVGGLDEGTQAERRAELAGAHDALLVSTGDGLTIIGREDV